MSGLTRRGLRSFAAGVIAVAAGCATAGRTSGGSGSEGGAPPENKPKTTVEVRTDSPPINPEAPAERILYPADRRPEPRLLEKSDGRVTKFYPTKPKKADKLAKLLSGHMRLAPGQVSIQADFERANFAPPEKEKNLIDHYDLVIVTGTREEIRRVDNFIEMVEARMPVVEIEAKIVEITNETDFQLGIQSFFREADSLTAAGMPIGDPRTLFSGLSTRFDTDDALNTSNRSDFTGAILDLRAIHDELLVELLIQALQKESHAEILSAPKVAVLNGYSAEIVTGTEVPVQSAQLVGTQVFLNVSFVQTGITLRVTPYVINKDTVQLVVAPEVSAVTGFTPAVRGGFSNPIISTRNARTVVNIRNGSTYVIGGLISSTEIEDERKTPILGDIPIIKYLFSFSRSRKVYTQLVFFITPKIISSGSTPPTTLPLREAPR